MEILLVKGMADLGLWYCCSARLRFEIMCGNKHLDLFSFYVFLESVFGANVFSELVFETEMFMVYDLL
ncbi:hypothetical protein KFK09_000472 [Dendrobium nobile]|uniref:Uncharacterized protein n=1 Tax=Dendrobium nobile TaxID=94219 RepID=A0A8T3C8N3_DENNO|nr:hypothetical protein KFK09_000472 [Dendrobium nobile]